METNWCPGWMTGTLEAHTDVAPDIVMYKYAQEEATDAQAKKNSNYQAGLPEEPTQQEQCCHHPRVRRGHSPKWSKTTPRCSPFFKVFEVCGSSWIAKLVLPELAPGFTDFHSRLAGFVSTVARFFYEFSAFYPLFPPPLLTQARVTFRTFLNSNDAEPCRLIHTVVFLRPLAWPLICSYITCTGSDTRVHLHSEFGQSVSGFLNLW